MILSRNAGFRSINLGFRSTDLGISGSGTGCSLVRGANELKTSAGSTGFTSGSTCSKTTCWVSSIPETSSDSAGAGTGSGRGGALLCLLWKLEHSPAESELLEQSLLAGSRSVEQLLLARQVRKKQVQVVERSALLLVPRVQLLHSCGIGSTGCGIGSTCCRV